MSSIGADNVHSTNSESQEINCLNNTKLLKQKCMQLAGAKSILNNKTLGSVEKRQALDSISRARQEFNSKYEMFLVNKVKYNLPVFKYYDRSNYKGSFKYLEDRSKELEFRQFLDNGCSYLSEQFIYFETDSPEYDTVEHPAIDTTRVRYRYCAYPGLRLINKVIMELCDDANFDEYDIDQSRFFNAQCISERARPKWNECLGQDNEVDGVVELRDFGVDQINKFKIGNQTLKSTQPGLKLMIPLLFQHSTALSNALQIDSLQAKGLGYRFTLNKLSNIVKGVLIGAQPTDPDEDLKLKPLRVKDVKLYTRYYNFDEEVYNSLIENATMKMYKSSRVECSERLNVDRGDIKLKFTRYACEFLNFAIVKMSNCNDFDHWYKFGYHDNPITLATPAIRIVAGNPIVYVAPVNLFPRRNIIDRFSITNATTKLNTNTTHREEHYEIVSTYDQFKYCQEQGTRYYADNKYNQEYGTFSFAAKPGLTNTLSGLFSFTVNREFKLEYKLIDEFDTTRLCDEHLRFLFYYKTVNFLAQNKGHAAKKYKL